MSAYSALHVSQLLAAGRRLERSLAGHDDAVDDIEELERLAVVSEKITYEEFRFSDSDATTRDAQQSTEEALLGILLDVQQGNVLIAAGQATPEDDTDSTTSIAPFREALAYLETSQRELTRADSGGRSFFSVNADATQAVTTVDVNPAASMRHQTATTLSSMVSEADGVIQATVEALKKLDATKVAEAIANLARQFDSLNAAQRLIRLGLAKVKSALEGLRKLLGSGPLAAARSKIADIWSDIEKGTYTKTILGRMFGVEETTRGLESILARGDAAEDALRDANRALADLSARFANQAKLLRALVKTVTFGAGVIALLPFAAQAVPFVAGAYVLLLASVVIIGVDYADAGISFGFVRGVRSITNAVAPVAGATWPPPTRSAVRG